MRPGRAGGATKVERFKPAVGKEVLLALAGLMWVGVGVLLLHFSYAWLHGLPEGGAVVWGLAGAGVLLALVIHHFGFLRVVDKNLGRILPMEGGRCLFSFMSWRSYLTAGIMVLLGVGLRHSPVPKRYLSILYTGIGLALVLSSVRYLRVFFVQARRTRQG